MKSIILVLSALAAIASTSRAQSFTTEALHKKHSEALALFFYNNTLRMLNQNEDKDFDELIRDIQKMRFLMIKKEDSRFGNAEYKKLVSDYKAEFFEEIMTSRHDGKNFDVFLREQQGKSRGMLVLVHDADNLFVLDILGSIALDKVTKLFSTLDESTDIGKRIRDFTGDSDEEKKTTKSPGETN